MNLLQNLFPSLFGKVQALMPPKVLEPDVFKYDRDFRYSSGKHIHQFTNSTQDVLEVYVEMYCDRYVLQPGDEMTIIYDEGSQWPGLGLSTFISTGALTIYLQEFDTAIVLINGNRVEPWGHQPDAADGKA